MYKKIALSLFLAVATLHTIFWLANMATAAPLDVCPSGCTYATIQSAVDNAVPFDNINVSAGTYSENVVISKSLTIQGADASSTIVDGTDTDSVFTIEGSVAVTLTNMTITNGNAANSLPTSWGGGIAIERGDVTLDSVIVSNNFARSGGGISSSGGKLTILNSQIMNNIAGVDGDFTSAMGGGINVNEFSTPAQVVIVNTTIANNLAATNPTQNGGTAVGGGIASSVNSLLIDSSTISGNRSTSGVSSGSAGGIFISGSGGTISETIGIRNSTISGNTAVFAGGGIYVTNEAEVTLTNNTIVSNTTSLAGGGVYVTNSAEVTLTNSTIAGNITRLAGGIYVTDSAEVILTNSTIVSNTSEVSTGGILSVFDSTVNLRNVLVALNSPQDCFEDVGGFIHSHDHNLDSDDSCGLTEANDLPATPPLIGPLQDNGGSTKTHALLNNSPAINAGSNAVCPAQDQRGITRPQGPACDIGAYEFEEESFFTEFIYLPMIVKE